MRQPTPVAAKIPTFNTQPKPMASCSGRKPATSDPADGLNIREMRNNPGTSCTGRQTTTSEPGPSSLPQPVPRPLPKAISNNSSLSSAISNNSSLSSAISKPPGHKVASFVAANSNPPPLPQETSKTSTTEVSLPSKELRTSEAAISNPSLLASTISKQQVPSGAMLPQATSNQNEEGLSSEAALPQETSISLSQAPTVSRVENNEGASSEAALPHSVLRPIWPNWLCPLCDRFDRDKQFNPKRVEQHIYHM